MPSHRVNADKAALKAAALHWSTTQTELANNITEAYRPLVEAARELVDQLEDGIVERGAPRLRAALREVVGRG